MNTQMCACVSWPKNIFQDVYTETRLYQNIREHVFLADADVASLQFDGLGEMHVQPPSGLGPPDCCCQLRKSMCGTGWVSRNWHNKISEVAYTHWYYSEQNDFLLILFLIHRIRTSNNY